MSRPRKHTRARRDEDKEKRRNDILDAAERVIAREGLAKATFGRIAKQSRLSRALIYVYFPTHDELVYGVCRRGLEGLLRRFETVCRQHSTGLEQVLAMARAYELFSVEEPLYFQVISDLETKHMDHACMSEVEQDVTTSGRNVIGLVAAAVQKGVKDGSISRDTGDPTLTALSVWAFTHGLIQVSTRKDDMLRDDFNLSGARLLEHGFNTLRNALVGPGARAK